MHFAEKYILRLSFSLMLVHSLFLIFHQTSGSCSYKIKLVKKSVFVDSTIFMMMIQYGSWVKEPGQYCQWKLTVFKKHLKSKKCGHCSCRRICNFHVIFSLLYLVNNWPYLALVGHGQMQPTFQRAEYNFARFRPTL